MPLIILTIAAAVFFFVIVPRMNELFLVSVREGELLVVRGRVPTRLHQDFKDVLDRAGVERATLRAVRSDGAARLVATGVDDGTAQQLRNVFGLYTIAKLKAAPVPYKRNVGQLLGFAWLAWLLTPRR